MQCRQAVPLLRVEPVTARKKRLLSLRQWIHKHRIRIQEAAYADLRKPAMEVDATEIFHVLNEISVALSSLDRWSRPRKIDAPLYMVGTRARVRYEPRGLCLVISPWNYPFSLAIGPLVSALAAGNAVILKPSEITPIVSALIRELCEEIFDRSVVSVCEGGADVAQALLSLPFDHIFFTGSPAVGRIVMKAAAEHLTSVTLELGSKSPAIVCETAKLSDAAERIAVGKFVNNGQTCIAPDYLLVQESIAARFVEELVAKTKSLFASNGDFETSADYGRIVNDAHFDRLQGLFDDAVSRGANILWKGKAERSTRFIHPAILTEVPEDSRIMQEEIFGPLLPVIRFRHIDEALAVINARHKPLALYIFTSRASLRKKVLQETSSGGVCINDCGIQFLHHELPFGGINNSGMGKSHGYAGFQAFSNEKPVLSQKTGITSVRAFYPPSTSLSRKLMDWFLRLY